MKEKLKLAFIFSAMAVKFSFSSPGINTWANTVCGTAQWSLCAPSSSLSSQRANKFWVSLAPPWGKKNYKHKPFWKRFPVKAALLLHWQDPEEKGGPPAEQGAAWRGAPRGAGGEGAGAERGGLAAARAGESWPSPPLDSLAFHPPSFPFSPLPLLSQLMHSHLLMWSHRPAHPATTRNSAAAIIFIPILHIFFFFSSPLCFVAF